MGQRLGRRARGHPASSAHEGLRAVLANGAATYYWRQLSKTASFSRNPPGRVYQGLRRFLFSINKHSEYQACCLLRYLMVCGPLPDVPSLCNSPHTTPSSGTWWRRRVPGLGAGQSRAWDTAPQSGSLLQPSDYIWALSGPCGLRPRPAGFPGTQAGTRRSLPMAMCPPGCQGQGLRGRGKIPSETQRQPLLPRDQRTTPQRKVCLCPPWRLRSSLPLKGHVLLTGSGRSQGGGIPGGPQGWAQTAPRPQLGSAHLQPPSK